MTLHALCRPLPAAATKSRIDGINSCHARSRLWLNAALWLLQSLQKVVFNFCVSFLWINLQ